MELRICISTRLPGVAGTVGPRTLSREASALRTCHGFHSAGMKRWCGSSEKGANCSSWLIFLSSCCYLLYFLSQVYQHFTCNAVRAQPRTPSTLGAHQGTMVTEVSPESLFCFVCSLPVVSLFFISSPFHTSYSLPALPLSDGFPGTAGMNSDFTVIGEKLTLKTGPWVRTTLGTLFKLLGALVYF